MIKVLFKKLIRLSVSGAKSQGLNSEEELHSAFNAIYDAIFVHPLKEDGFAAFVDVNDIACERYGYTHDEFMNLSAPDITIKHDVNGHGQQNHRKEVLEKRRLNFETFHLKKSGETFPVEINSNIFYQNDTPYILAVVRDITERKQVQKKRELLIVELQEALKNVKTLRGILPICAKCKKIRDDKGNWNILEEYIEKYSDVSFSHGMCPECSNELYGNEAWYIQMKKKGDN